MSRQRIEIDGLGSRKMLRANMNVEGESLDEMSERTVVVNPNPLLKKYI